MKAIKSMFVSLLMMVSFNSFSQVKINEPVKEIVDLQTLDFEVEKSGQYTYYVNTLYATYKYPTIKEGYYTIGIWEELDGLINLYQQLVNVSTMSDGEYQLTGKYTKYDVTKKGTKIIFNRVKGEYIPLGKKIKGDTATLQADLDKLKSLKQ